MKSISKQIFIQKVKTLDEFKLYVKNNNIKLPNKSTKRREIFINWYMDIYSDEDINTDIRDLARYYLYISERSLINLLFKNNESK